MSANDSAPMSVSFLLVLLRFLRPLLPLRSLWRKCTFRLLALQLREFSFHLDDQYLQLLLALLAGVGVDIAGVLFTVGPFWRIASFKEMVVNLTDAAGARPALAAHVGLEVGHTRLFRLGRGSFLPRLRSVLLRRCFADAAVDVGGGREPHVVGDVGIDVQCGGRRHMAQHGGEGFHIHAVFQSQRCESMAKVMKSNMLAPRVFQDELQSAAHHAGCNGTVLFYRDMAYPVTKEFREQLNTAVLQAYEAKLEQMAERGSVGRASISDQLKAGKAAAEQAKAERPPKEKPSRGAER